jgi:hypothetical protein
MVSLSFLCFPRSHIFTADPRGVLKLWNIRNALYSNAHALTASQEVSLVAVFESPLGARIMCLDASLQDEVTPFLLVAYLTECKTIIELI